MAENGPDLSAELARSGVKLRDLAEKPELKSGLLAEIVGKLTDAKAEGVLAIESAGTKDELLASLPKLVENVKASPSHIDKQVAGIVGKLADKEKYPVEEASAKALLEKGMVASERGYLGYIARQKYENVATTLGWSKGEEQGTAKAFIDNFLSEKPTNADEIRLSLTTLDPNSPLENSLSGTHSAKSFENMMKKKWEATTEISNSPEKDTNTQIIESLIGTVKLDEFDQDKDWNEPNQYCVRQLQTVQAQTVQEFTGKLDHSQPILDQVKNLPHIAKLTKKDAIYMNDWVAGRNTQDSPHDSSLEDIGKALRDLYATQKLIQEQAEFDNSNDPDTNCLKATKQMNEALWPDVWSGNPPPLKINWETINLDSAKSRMLGEKVFKHIALTQLPNGI